METEVRVKEAMTRKVVTIPKDTTVDKAAKIMADRNMGSIVIMENNKPIGILTERDISYRIVAKDKKPSEVKVGNIMSTNLKTVSEDITITDACKVMVKHNIRRLPVMKGDRMVGIITNKDILAISPEQIEILKELSRMEHTPQEKEVPDSGTCENCGDYGVKLYEVNGIFVCESCKEDMLGGE